MPRKIWFRKSTGSWYTQFGRKQKRLADNEAEAKRDFKRLLAEEIPKIPPYLAGVTVLQICKAFMAYTCKNHAPDTIDWNRRYLEQFCRVFGGKKAASLDPEKVDASLHEKKIVPVGRAKNGEPC